MLTEREQDIYRFIRRFIAQHGHGPLLAEIALGIGIRSKGTVHRYVQSLAARKLISVQPGRHRGITLAPDQSDRGKTGAIAAELGQPAGLNMADADMSLPLLGRIAAGLPIEAIPDQNHVNLSEFLMGPNRFILKVQGESMIEAGILDGDMVIIEQRNHADDGEIIVALIDHEEATLKRLQHNDDGSVTLLPANSQMVPMIYAAERVLVQGVVVAQLRSYR